MMLLLVSNNCFNDYRATNYATLPSFSYILICDAVVTVWNEDWCCIIAFVIIKP